jgi:hypothetical protein
MIEIGPADEFMEDPQAPCGSACPHFSLLEKRRDDGRVADILQGDHQSHRDPHRPLQGSLGRGGCGTTSSTQRRWTGANQNLYFPVIAVQAKYMTYVRYC